MHFLLPPPLRPTDAPLMGPVRAGGGAVVPAGLLCESRCLEWKQGTAPLTGPRRHTRALVHLSARRTACPRGGAPHPALMLPGVRGNGLHLLLRVRQVVSGAGKQEAGRIKSPFSSHPTRASLKAPVPLSSARVVAPRPSSGEGGGASSSQQCGWFQNQVQEDDFLSAEEDLIKVSSCSFPAGAPRDAATS